MRLTILYFIASLLNLCLNAQTVHTIQVSSFSFAPNNIPNVSIGDTIRFVKVSGTHTAHSTNVPQGANPFAFQNATGDYIPLVAGTYQYQCNIHTSMQGSFTVSTSSKQKVSNSNIQLYPTVTSDFVNIKSENKIISVQIHSILGVKVLNKDIQSNQTVLNLIDLESGCYFITINTIEGITTQKLIKN